MYRSPAMRVKGTLIRSPLGRGGEKLRGRADPRKERGKMHRAELRLPSRHARAQNDNARRFAVQAKPTLRRMRAIGDCCWRVRQSGGSSQAGACSRG
eukprot:447977-Pleurochrysis_carterae.AAC.3